MAIETMLTSEQAAEILNLTARRVVMLCTSGELKHVRLGTAGHIRIKPEWLEDYIQKHTHGGTESE